MTEQNVSSSLKNDQNMKGKRQKCVGLLTSGGDSQGMNSAIRAIVREVIRTGARCFFIHEGFTGLMTGKIDEAQWSSVANITHTGGSFIGSSRCDEFRSYDGRKKAALKMFEHRIFHLIVIGGDGSLTGLQKLKEEWAKIGEELFAEGKISLEIANEGRQLNVAGIVGSIDNDCIETDKSIGSDTALHRICESIDGLMMTAQTHQRIFVVEVMGRHCGYLALTAAIAVEADFVFYPEMPPDENWPELLCNQLETVRKLGKRQNVIILGEGARNAKGERIEAKTIKNEIENRMQVEVRTACLGHLQRGGTPSFLDRLLGLRMGHEAVQEVFGFDSYGKPLSKVKPSAKVMCLRGHYIVRQDLNKVLRKSESVNEEAKQGNFDTACQMRGFGFLDKKSFLEYVSYPLKTEMPKRSKVFAIIHVDLPVAGMNAVTFSFTRMANHSNIEVIGIRGAWEGLKCNDVVKLTWENVQGWSQQGGSLLEAKLQLPSELDKIAESFNSHNIDGIAIVGGFSAFYSALILQKNRDQYAAFNIPIVVVPATIYNNCPGTCSTLGADTALNEICRQVDNIRQSAIGSRNKVMIIETMGGRCSYLATMTALATGSDFALIHQRHSDEADIRRIAVEAKRKLNSGESDKFLVIRSDNASDSVSISRVKSIFDSVIGNEFGVRITNLGWSQLGGHPSCFDRQMGIRMGIRAFEGIVSPNKMGKRDCCIIGLRGSRLKYIPISGLERKACLKHSVQLNMWWLDIWSLIEDLTWKPDNLDENNMVKAK